MHTSNESFHKVNFMPQTKIDHEIPEHLKAVVLQAAQECGADAIEVYEDE